MNIKKIMQAISLTLILALVLSFHAFAATAEDNDDIIYFDDGSYIVIEISSIDTRASSIKRGSKTYTYKGNDGIEEWRAVLYGTFTYTGSSATCTASSCSVSITDTDWYEVSKTVSKSGASAIVDLTMGRKLLGITVKKQAVNITLTCDANGNLS